MCGNPPTRAGVYPHTSAEDRAGACCLPATASAATLRGTVVAPPKVTKTSAVIPILDASGATRKVVVPVKGAIRARIGRLTAGQLRYGDAVTATGTKKALVGAKPRAKTLRVGTRGTTMSFDAIGAGLQATQDGVTQALAQVQALPVGGVSTLSDVFQTVLTVLSKLPGGVDAR